MAKPGRAWKEISGELIGAEDDEIACLKLLLEKLVRSLEAPAAGR